MKIKLAILERDQSYLMRIVSVFNTKYTENFEIYSFTDKEVALSYLESAKIDVLIANDIFEIDVKQLPKRCAFAYFVDSPDIYMENDQRAIFKYQKVDLIYKQILGIYSEKATSISGIKRGDESCKIIIFNSVSGGAGASTIAAAAAVHFSAMGKRTLYLNLEKFGSSDIFFHAEGSSDMSDIVYAIKSRKVHLALKLESCVRQDLSGVYFYSQPQIALDMLELTREDILQLLSELRVSGSYEYIVVDMDFALNQDTLEIYRESSAIVWVAEGTKISNAKVFRAYTALSTLEENAEFPLTNRLGVIYNKFHSQKGEVITEEGLNMFGGVPWYAQGSITQMVTEISKLNIFDKLV